MKSPYDYTKDFEKSMAEFCGAPYAVAVESGSAALFLSLQWWKSENCFVEHLEVPKHTYPSVPASVMHAGYKVKFTNCDWQDKGYYQLWPLPIVDSAKFIGKKMYYNNGMSGFVCLSFHGKKCLPIGRGGMILTGDETAYKWLKLARFDGRHEVPLANDIIEIVGWNMYMTPEQAVRGLELMQYLKDVNISPSDKYPDLSKMKCFKGALNGN